MAELHHMYGWRDVAHYVADEVQPALVQCLDSLTKMNERHTAHLERFGQLVKAHNRVVAELNVRLTDLEARIDSLERRS